MKKVIDDGGPVHPIKGPAGEYSYGGETRRQALARCAMKSYIVTGEFSRSDAKLASASYASADAMLAFERAEKEGANDNARNV